MTDAKDDPHLSSIKPPSTLKGLPRPISIRHSQSYDPAPLTPTSLPISGELRTTRSSASLNLLSAVKPFNFGNKPQDTGQRPRQIPFSNTIKRLQNTFAASKKTLEQGRNAEETAMPDKTRLGRALSSASSANSLTSWRSKGAEILNKSLGRNRKNSEPVMKSSMGPGSAAVIFGNGIEDAVRRSHIPDTPLVPAVLYRCAEFLEVNGVEEVGLYRIPGSHASVQKLKHMFDTGKDYDLLTMGGHDPNDIATLLKLYLRELPHPLMPAALLDEFQSLLTSDRNVYLTLREMLLRLPRSNYNVLSYLCHHLSKIATHSDKTKMTVSNLALVFAPTLGIGHVLFQALLGNFHESGNTPENKENGLQLVWGDHMQDHGYDSTEWLDTDAEKEEYETLSSGLLHRHSMPVGERGLFNRGIAALSASYGEMSLQDLDKQSRNRRTLASPISSSVLSYDSLGEAGLSEEVRLMKTMLQREGSGVTSSTLDSENVEATIENEEKKLMDEMLQREANEPISTTILISESLGVAIENEESRLMQDMLEREEMAVKSGLEYSPPPPAAAVTSSNTSSTTNLPSHLTSTAIVRNEVTNIADLGASLPSTDMPIAPQGADMSNVTIKAGAMTPTPLNNPSPKEPVSVTPDVLGAGAMIDSNTSFREPLSLNSVPGTITPFQGVSVAV